MLSKFLIPIILFVVTFNVYIFTSAGETEYNYFSRLSRSFINGKLYLTENPPWLNELVPVDGKYYVVYPPMPAILLLPLVSIFGIYTQTFFSIFLGSINVVLVFLVLKRLNLSDKTAIFISLFFGLGTNHFYLSTVGSAWFIAHIVAVFFLLVALLETFGGKRLFLIGLALGAAFWSRTPVIFTVVFFCTFLFKKFWPINVRNFINLSLFSLGIGIFVLIDGYYNFLRFGDFSPFAPYHLIPNIDKDPVFNQGFMSLSFIPRHLDAILLRVPKFFAEPPFIVPSLYATAIWFTSPAILLIFKAKKNLLSFACWAAVITVFLVIITWAGVGYAQWGYRFAQDFMPFILILMAVAIGNKPSKLSYLLIVLSILLNSWGTFTINKLGIFYI